MLGKAVRAMITGTSLVTVRKCCNVMWSTMSRSIRKILSCVLGGRDQKYSAQKSIGVWGTGVSRRYHDETNNATMCQ